MIIFKYTTLILGLFLYFIKIIVKVLRFIEFFKADWGIEILEKFYDTEKKFYASVKKFYVSMRC